MIIIYCKQDNGQKRIMVNHHYPISLCQNCAKETSRNNATSAPDKTIMHNTVGLSWCSGAVILKLHYRIQAFSMPSVVPLNVVQILFFRLVCEYI